MIETKIKKIVDILTKDYEFHSSEEIASILNLSSRTIRNEIKSYNSLKNTGSEIELISGKGCKFTVYNENLFKEFLLDRWEKIAFETYDANNPEYRREFIIKKLLFKDSYIKVENLEEELKVSRSQINNDLKLIKNNLKKFKLKVVSKPNYGISIVGTEMDKRLFISNNLYNNYSNENFSISEKFDKKLISTIEKILENVLKRYGYDMRLMAVRNLVIHIYIMVNRVRENNYLTLSNFNYLINETNNELEISKEIIGELENKLNIIIPEPEINYIAIHLLGKRNSKNNNIPYSIENIVTKMLELVDKEYGVELINDLDLKVSLSLHIIPMIDRIKYGLVMKNPLIDDIRKDAIAFEFARTSVRVIEEMYGIKVNDDEIGYIALHISLSIDRLKSKKIKKNILIVCATGVGTANLMKYKFLNLYEEYIKDIVTCDYFEINKINLDEFDLIISSIALDIETKTPIIEVEVFFDKTDINNINQFLESDKESYKFEKYFNEKMFYIDTRTGLTDYMDILKEICIDLEEHVNPKDLHDGLLEREKLGSTSIGNGVALPHPINSIGNKTFFYVYINENGIKFKGNIINLIILLNIVNPETSSELDEFFYFLSNLISSRENVNRIIKSNNIYDFIEIIKTMQN